MFVKNRIEDRMEAEMTVSGMEDMKMAASAASTRSNSADRSCYNGPRNTCKGQKGRSVLVVLAFEKRIPFSMYTIRKI